MQWVVVFLVLVALVGVIHDAAKHDAAGAGEIASRLPAPGFVAIVVGAGGVLSAAVMWAIWSSGSPDNRWFDPIVISGIAGLALVAAGRIVIAVPGGRR